MEAIQSSVIFLLNVLDWLLWPLIGLVVLGAGLIQIVFVISIIWNFIDWIRKNFF